MSGRSPLAIHCHSFAAVFAGETFGEMVLGMGEALAGNYPGRALSFVERHWASEDSEGELMGTPVVLAFPSKRVGVFASGGGVIARSDSTGEDLVGFSGAGLYDSVVCGRGVEERPLVRAWDLTLQCVLLPMYVIYSKRG